MLDDNEAVQTVINKNAVARVLCESEDGNIVTHLVHYKCVSCKHVVTSALCLDCVPFGQASIPNPQYSCEDGCCYVSDLRLTVSAIELF